MAQGEATPDVKKADLAKPAVTAPAAEQVTPSFLRGFDGIASVPFSAEQTKILLAAPDPNEVEIRTDGIVFLPGVAYRRLMIRAFGAGGWALAPRMPAQVRDGIVLYQGALYVLGRFVSEAVGECAQRGVISYASALEGARTDCLTRCCKDLGVASELWDKTWRDAWQAQYAERKGDKWHKRQAADAKRQAADAETGEAPDDKLLEEMRSTAMLLKWGKAKAETWLKATFGETSPGALTRQQATDAVELLKAFTSDDDDTAYSYVYDRLKTAGRVL